MEQILSANNLTMRYHQTLALDGLTLNLPKEDHWSFGTQRQR